MTFKVKDGISIAGSTLVDGNRNITANSVTAPVITANVAQGTAPLVITSTTVVANLNADLLDGQQGTYYTNATNLATGTVPAARLPQANTTSNGAVVLLDSVSNTSVSVYAPTANAVKTAYDAAITANTNASNASFLSSGTVAAARMPAFTGDVTAPAGTANLTLANTAVTAGTYGNASSIPAFTVDSKGRITNVTETAVAGVSGYAYTPANNTFTITTSAGGSYNATIGTVNAISVTGVLTASANVNVTGNVTATGTFIAPTLTSNVATGTAPLTVTSTTKVTNLNADLLDDQTGAYYTNATNLATGTVPAARLPQANATSNGAVLILDSVTNTSISVYAASANSVKTAYDKAVSEASTAYSNATTYAATIAGTAYSNATTYSSNASNLTSGTVADGRLVKANTTANGVVTLLDSVSNTATSGYAPTPNAVKTAYDAAVTANTNASNASFLSSGTVGDARLTKANTTANGVVMLLDSVSNTSVASYAPTANAVKTAYDAAITANTNASNATFLSSGTVAAARLPAFTGDATAPAGTANLTLANTAVTAGTYGNSSVIPQITVDSKGRVTSASNIASPGLSSFAYTAANNTFAIGKTDGGTLTATISTVNSFTVSQDLVVSGNLTVSGTTTYINTTQLNIGDNIVVLNADLGAVAPTENAGIEVNRGTSANVQFIWDETNDTWDIGNTAVSGYVNASSTITGTQLVSTIATGTKPLSVTSTTLVDNLNADLLDGQHSTYYANATHTHSLTVGNGSVTQITYNASDTLHIVGGTNVSVAYDDATNKVTISANDTSIAYSELTGRPNMWYNLTDGTTTATPDAESDTFTFAQGGGLTVAVDSTNDKVTYSHADTSTVANVASDNAGLTFIQDLTLQFDTYGHVTNASVATASVTIPNNFGTVTVLDDPGTGYTWADNGSVVADSTSDTLSIVSGAGIVIDVDAATDALRFSHEDTSSAANLAASGRTYVTGLTFDTYGHITAYTTGTETVTDTNTTYDLLAVANTAANQGRVRLSASTLANDDVLFVGSGSVTVSSNSTQVTISGVDNNTTYDLAAVANTAANQGRVRLTASSLANDDVLFVGSGSVTVSSNTTQVTISGVDNNTTYDLLAVANTVANEGILRLKDSGNANDDVKIVGSGATTISSNATHIIISSTDNNTDTLQSVSDDTTTNATYYPSFVTATSGAQTAKVSSTKLTFNPSTGLLTASGLSGSTLTSTVATGTAPLTVASTTAVTNLNADLLDGNHSTAFAPNTGSSSITTVGTISTGTWQGTDIGLAYGGTNATLTAAAGAVAFSNSTAISLSAAGTAGQVLASGGTGTPTWISNTVTVGSTGIALGGTATTIAGLTSVTSTTFVGSLNGTANVATHVSGGALGSLPYQSAATTTALLAGNITTTKQFLSQAGTGSVSAAPAWSTVSKSDVGLGSVENTALSTWAGSANVTTLGTIATGTWQATDIGLAYGGTGSTLTAAAGAIAFSNATGVALSSPGTAGQVLASGGTGTPTWIANSVTIGSTGLALGGTMTALAGITTIAAGNTTITGWANVSVNVNSASLSVGTAVVANTTGVTTTGAVSAANGLFATSANPFVYNATTVSANVSMPSNYNAMAAGPITINNGVTVTIPDGSVMTIV